MTTRYTTRALMGWLFKSLGVEYRIEDSPDCDETLNFFIDDASSQIGAFLEQVYYPADLAGSTWVKIRATWLACYRLSQRGGNPSLFYGRVQEIMDELNAVKNGLLPIPGLATRADFIPSMSNIEHDPRYRDATRRVDPETSTPGLGGTRPQDITEYPGGFTLF